jgi:hypothetical protein
VILALHRALPCVHVAGLLLNRRLVSLQAKAAPVVASADVRQAAGKLGAALALAAVVSFGAADLAEAKTVQPYAGLTPCAGNKAFEKREKNEIKGLTKRLKQVGESTRPPYSRPPCGQSPPRPSTWLASARLRHGGGAGGRAPAGGG